MSKSIELTEPQRHAAVTALRFLRAVIERYGSAEETVRLADYGREIEKIKEQN